jgi:hypothetical protein
MLLLKWSIGKETHGNHPEDAGDGEFAPGAASAAEHPASRMRDKNCINKDMPPLPRLAFPHSGD